MHETKVCGTETRSGMTSLGKKWHFPDLFCVLQQPGEHRKLPFGHQCHANAIQMLPWCLLGEGKASLKETKSETPGSLGDSWQQEGICSYEPSGEAQERRNSFLCLVLSMHNEMCHFEITEQTVENDQKFWCTQFSPWEGKISYFPNAWGKQIPWECRHTAGSRCAGCGVTVGLQCSIYKNSQSWNCPIGEKFDCLRNKIKWSPSSFCEGPCKASIQRDGFSGRLNERMPKGQWVIEAGPPPLQVPASVWAWNAFQAWNFYTGACSWTRYAPLWVWTLNLFLSLSLFFFSFLVLFFYSFYLFVFDCAGSSLLCRLFSNCGERGLLFIAVSSLLVVAASRCRSQALEHEDFCGCRWRAQEHGLSSCDPWA